MPIKYNDELKTRAVDLVIHAQADPSTANGASRRVAKELGLSSETLRTWVRNYKNSGAMTPAQSIDLEAENKRLRAELAETKRANELLKKAATFFAGLALGAFQSNHRFHRSAQGRARGRAEHPCVARNPCADRRELVLCGEEATTFGPQPSRRTTTAETSCSA